MKLRSAGYPELRGVANTRRVAGERASPSPAP